MQCILVMACVGLVVSSHEELLKCFVSCTSSFGIKVKLQAVPECLVDMLCSDSDTNSNSDVCQPKLGMCRARQSLPGRVLLSDI